MERLLHIPVEACLASEFRYSEPLLGESALVIVISQSGETLDSMEALREAKRKGSKVLSIVNVMGSSIAREAYYVALNRGCDIDKPRNLAKSVTVE